MIYFIEFRKDAEHTAGPKAPHDIYDISRKLGYKNIDLVLKGANSKFKRKFDINKLWMNLLFKIKKDDFIIFQHPTYGIKEAIKFIPLFRKVKKAKFITVIHDLELLRGGVSTYDNEIAILSDKVLLPMFDKIICHDESMKKYLIKEGICESKLVTLDIFDYLTNSSELSENKGIGLTIAGNLNKDKSGYLYKLIERHPNYTLNLYGPNFDESIVLGENINYLGSFSPDELPNKLQGQFGLVWDGDSIETCSGNTGNYLRYNNPHKTSLYLAAGIPVLIWKEAAIAKFVEEHNVGILIDNLEEIEEVLNNISQEKLDEMQKNAKELSLKLRDGYYFKTAIEKCLNRGEVKEYE